MCPSGVRDTIYSSYEFINFMRLLKNQKWPAIYGSYQNGRDNGRGHAAPAAGARRADIRVPARGETQTAETCERGAFDAHHVCLLSFFACFATTKLQGLRGHLGTAGGGSGCTLRCHTCNQLSQPQLARMPS